MKVCLLWMLVLFTGVGGAGAQTSCSGFSNSKTLSRLQPSDTSQHTLGGQHSFGITPVASCIYTAGNSATCDTECIIQSVGSSSINPIGSTITTETGTLTVVGTHNVSGGWNPADNSAFGAGQSCTGQVIGAAVNCFTVPTTQQCFVTVSISAGGVSLNTNATPVWNSGPVEVKNTCAAQKDPTKTVAGGPPPPPPNDCPPATQPLLPGGATSLIQPGPVGNFTTPPLECDPQNPSSCPCDPLNSPIIIDTTGRGYNLTSAGNGVLFDISGTGALARLGWTQPGSGNAFLALPDANGQVSNGKQLFGNFTPQPPSATPNGYAALAVYDQPEHGGNGDGVIDQKDRIYSSLRLWLDENHDGICQPEELHTLPELGVFSISLSYSLSHRVDDFGNVFRYRADVNYGMSGPSDVGRKAFDVFLTAR